MSGLSMEEHAYWWTEAGESELRQILYWRWDPIGGVAMGSFPNSYDEYDDYAGPVMAVLKRGEGAAEVESLLRDFEHDNMGLKATEATDQSRHQVAEMIETWYSASIAFWKMRR